MDSRFGFRSDDFFGTRMFGGEPSHRDLFNNDACGYYPSRPSPPCPRHAAIRTSHWSQGLHGRLQLQVSVPGALPKQSSASLSEDGLSLVVRASRPVSGRWRDCPSSGAFLSADGRFETLKASIPVPSMDDMSKATFRTADEGHEIIVPLRVDSAAIPFPSESLLSDRPGKFAPSTEAQPRLRRRTSQPGASVEVGFAMEGMTNALSAPGKLSIPEEPTVSDGVAIIDEEPEWPEKLPDASSGWTDNRGEFQDF